MVHERQFEFPADGARLAGTLTLPDRPGDVRPAALLIGGSGPLDRDGNLPDAGYGIGSALAAALAARGHPTLRYDKRGVGASGGDYLSTGFHAEVADAAAALAALAAETAGVFVIGHSTGAVVAAAMIRAGRLHESSPAPAGFVLLAGAARPGADVMRWQSDRIAATLPWFLRPLGPLLVRRQARERERVLRSTADRHDQMPRSRLTDRWLREYMAHDPCDDLGTIDRPVLAITGAKDVQVDPADVRAIGRLVAGEFDGETPADLTHLLRRDDGPPGLLRYRKQMARPVDEWVGERIATWADARLGR
jgi:pimeloyl-ACP methyl ester carboxylesterase